MITPTTPFPNQAYEKAKKEKEERLKAPKENRWKAISGTCENITQK